MTQTPIADSTFDPIYAALDWAQDAALPTPEYVQLLSDWQGIVAGRLEQAVIDLRCEGWTWQQIGDLFGVTRQAAQQRWS